MCLFARIAGMNSSLIRGLIVAGEKAVLSQGRYHPSASSGIHKATQLANQYFSNQFLDDIQVENTCTATLK